MHYPWFKTLNLSNEYKKSISNIIDSNKMTMGKVCIDLENKLKKLLGFKHLILTTSGTSALMMAALSLNIKKNELVYVSNYTWIASINPFIICGAKIKTFDTKENSHFVDFKLLNREIILRKPKIVILVNLNGESYIDKEFINLKKKLRFTVIEDCAQSLFVKNNFNKISGLNSDISCFSLSITKLFNMVYGGFCATNNDLLARKMRMIRNNGVDSLPENAKLELAKIPGLNLKPNDLNASIGMININNRKKIISKSKLIYKIYCKYLKNPKLKILRIENLKNSIPIYISIFVDNRNKFSKFCQDKNIGIHFALRSLTSSKIIEKKDNFNYKNSKFLSDKLIRLPSGPGYDDKEIKKICNILNQY